MPAAPGADAVSVYVDGQLRLYLDGLAAEQVWIVAKDIPPTSSGVIAFRVTSYDGPGEILLEFSDSSAGATWAFSIDPTEQEWSLLRRTPDDTTWFDWVPPQAIAGADAEGSFVAKLSIRDRHPVLLIDGVVQTERLASKLPPVAGEYLIGFGANITTGVSDSRFEASFSDLVVFPDQGTDLPSRP